MASSAQLLYYNDKTVSASKNTHLQKSIEHQHNQKKEKLSILRRQEVEHNTKATSTTTTTTAATSSTTLQKTGNTCNRKQFQHKRIYPQPQEQQSVAATHFKQTKVEKHKTGDKEEHKRKEGETQEAEREASDSKGEEQQGEKYTLFDKRKIVFITNKTTTTAKTKTATATATATTTTTTKQTTSDNNTNKQKNLQKCFDIAKTTSTNTSQLSSCNISYQCCNDTFMSLQQQADDVDGITGNAIADGNLFYNNNNNNNTYCNNKQQKCTKNDHYQTKQQLQPSSTFYKTIFTNNSNDYAGIEESTTHNNNNTKTTTTANTVTNMPHYYNNSSSNNNNVETFPTARKISNTAKNSSALYRNQHIAATAATETIFSSISYYDNTMPKIKESCQQPQKQQQVQPTNVAKQYSCNKWSLNNYIDTNEAATFLQNSFRSTATTTTTSTKQQNQQRNLFGIPKNISATNQLSNFKLSATSTKFFQDVQHVAKCFFSLLLIFNMLPLFYAECDQTFVSRIGGPQNGTFTAPLLHNHKNHSRQCLYTFLAGPGQRVEVIFKVFNLRGNPPDGSAVGELPSCVHEYMDIYSEVQSSEPAELINSPFGGRYCGTIPPRQRISMYRAVAISFFTNKNITTPDLFEGTYRFINASEYEIGIPIAGSPCSYTITPSLSINKTGVLISPTYPGAYPKDMSCTYQFLGESNQRVRLEFRDFDLFFGGPHCPFDFVKVYDGPDNSSALIGAYCGQQRNLVLYSSESSLFVHFYTLPRTANTQNRGFKGIYEFSESFVKLDFIRENDGIHMRGSECDQKILSKKESTGFVLSPNYPYPYIPKTVCRYFIYGMQDAQHLERVRLEFTNFNIPKVEHKDKGESNCTDGYLKVYLKGQETADAYDKFDYELCGNETQRVISDGPRLAMVFSSGELQGRGFKGKYTFETEYKIPGTAAPDGSCSFTYVSTSKKRGELNSPRYPSNYPSDTNCSYLFLAETNEQVTIVFDHFKIKADGNANVTAGAYGSVNCFEDWLEMYVVYRDNNDRFLGRYCGVTAPGPVESPRGALGLRITLHTDQENVASGFKARYFFETAKAEIGDCGGNFSNEDSGIITSPNYPAGYKAPSRGMASMACNWIMTARPGYKLSIHFEHFSLEGDPANRGCPAAVLRLWVNVESDQPPLELCGEKPLPEQWHYISTGQTARISFTTSDKTVGAQGFRIVWTEIQDSGPGPPSIGLLCESTYHFQCEVGYCISDKLRCDGVKNCGPNDDSDEMHCESYHKSASGGSRRSNYNNTSRRLVPNLSPMHTLSLQKKT